MLRTITTVTPIQQEFRKMDHHRERRVAAPELVAVVRRALSRSPVDRYSSAAAFLRDLIAIGEGEWVPDLLDSLAEDRAGQFGARP
jgi:hypothetical protein